MTKKVTALRAWIELSNVAGLDATKEGVEIEKKGNITGKYYENKLYRLGDFNL